MGVSEWFSALFGRASSAATKKAVETAVERAGDALADDLELALLGKKGAADEIAAKGEPADPLELARQKYGVGPASSAPVDDAAAREAKARAELAELKKKLGKP